MQIEDCFCDHKDDGRGDLGNHSQGNSMSEPGQEIDKSNASVIFERNQVIDDFRVFTTAS